MPLFPPENARSLLRLRAIARDADAAFALTTSGVLEGLNASDSGADLERTRIVATDSLDAGAADDWRRPDGARGERARVPAVHAGSTAAPRRRIRHANVMTTSAPSSAGHDERSVLVSWLPLFHDMGLVGTALQAAFVGARFVLMAPEQFLQRPVRWLQAISRHRATTSGGPNFTYDLCAAKITEEEKAALDLSSWAVAFNGAEPVRAATVARFHAAFASTGFRRESMVPGYGLAEATMAVTVGNRAAPPVILPCRLALGRIACSPRRVDADPRVLVSSGRAALRGLAMSTRSGAPSPTAKSVRSGSRARASRRGTGGARKRRRRSSARRSPGRTGGGSCAPATSASCARASSSSRAG